MGSRTWIVKVIDYESVEYGGVVQTVVAANTPEEAKSLCVDLLDVSADKMSATPYNLGAGADDLATKMANGMVDKVQVDAAWKESGYEHTEG